MASIVRGFKAGVTKNARQIDPNFAWQPRYWDHIIKNENAYHRLSQYIIDNPRKWAEDKLNGGKGNVVLESIVGYGTHTPPLVQTQDFGSP